MPQLKCEVSKEELTDFENMMEEFGIESRYGMVKVLVTGALDEWRKKKVERGIREESDRTTDTDKQPDKTKRRIL